MELSTVESQVSRISPAACRFALHSIVSISSKPSAPDAPAWNEVLIRPGSSHKNFSPLRLVSALYADDYLGTDIAVLNRVSNWLSSQRVAQRASINIHPESLVHREFLAAAVEALDEAGSHGHSICFELIEFGQCLDRRGMVKNANYLRRHGALIALDDFGSQLNFFDMCAAGIVDYIKIDISVTDGIDSCTNRQAIALGIKTLADGLGAHVIAEGIETQAQLSILQGIGIAYGQGYFFQKPTIEEGI